MGSAPIQRDWWTKLASQIRRGSTSQVPGSRGTT